MACATAGGRVEIGLFAQPFVRNVVVHRMLEFHALIPKGRTQDNLGILFQLPSLQSHQPCP